MVSVENQFEFQNQPEPHVVKQIILNIFSKFSEVRMKVIKGMREVVWLIIWVGRRRRGR